MKGTKKKERKRIAQALTKWFDSNQRDLPWRRRRNGYTALVAEIMLQQTQAARVAERFPMFLRLFPNVKALARASEQKVLKAWEGMGFYRRALLLRSAAISIVERFGGRVPRTNHELLQLPGVGRYTAGAIASIVFGERAAIVDGNVRRVLSRLRRSASGERTWDEAQALVDVASNPGAFNEALMELGATICTPREPRCRQCPLKRWCPSREGSGIDAGSRSRAGLSKRIVHHHAVIVRRPDGRVLVEQRDRSGMWRGMWQTPTIETDRSLSLLEVKQAFTTPTRKLKHCNSFKHETTHRRIMFQVFTASSNQRTGTWCDAAELKALPMSNAQRRALELAGLTG